MQINSLINEEQAVGDFHFRRSWLRQGDSVQYDKVAIQVCALECGRLAEIRATEPQLQRRTVNRGMHRGGEDSAQ